MSRLRSRALAVASLCVAVVLFAAPTAATADTTSPGDYHAAADATALDLTVLGQGMSLGLTHSENASDPKSSASAVGALVPGLGNQTEQTAAASPQTALDDHSGCGPVALPANFPAVTLSDACSSATATVSDAGLPAAKSNATVATLDVNGNQVLGSASSAVNQPIGSLLDGLKPVFNAVDQGGIDANTLLNKIVTAITQDGDLVKISLGPSSTDTTATDATETATAAAQGAVIKVLPRDSLGLDPVVTINVGAATNTLTIDRHAGTAAVHYDPAIVRVTLAPDIAATLPNSVPNPIEVVPGQSMCLGLPAPLDSCITVAGGTSGAENGVTHAEATAVSLHLLTGVQDGIRLDLAKTSVQGVGVLDVARDAPPAAPAPVDSPPLARTGGSVPLGLGAGLMVLGVVGVMVSRPARRRGHLAY